MLPGQVLECPWHEVLFALYALEDVERPEALLAELADNERAFDTNQAVAGSRALQQKRDAILRRLQGAPRGATGMSLDELRTFPGMPDYCKPVS